MDQPFDQITRPELREMIYEKLKAGLSPKTVNNIKALISSVLSHAFEDELITVNPASRLGRFIKAKDRKAEINPLTRDEARALLEVLADRSPRYYPFFLVRLAHRDAPGGAPGPGVGRH